MNISELNVGQGNVEVEGTISEVGDVRSFDKFGKELKVANAMLKDDSGSIKLTLWNDDVEKYKEGDKIKMINGYVNEFQGEKQLTSGKFGSIEKAGSTGESTESEASEPVAEEAAEPTEETTEPTEETAEAEPTEESKEETPAEEATEESEEVKEPEETTF